MKVWASFWELISRALRKKSLTTEELEALLQKENWQVTCNSAKSTIVRLHCLGEKHHLGWGKSKESSWIRLEILLGKAAVLSSLSVVMEGSYKSL